MALIDYDVDANDYIIYARNALGQMDRVVDENGKTARLRAEVMTLSDEKAYDALMRKLVAAVERREGPENVFGYASRPEPPAPLVGPIRGKMKNGEWFDATDQGDVRRAGAEARDRQDHHFHNYDPTEAREEEQHRQREKMERHGRFYRYSGKMRFVWPEDDDWVKEAFQNAGRNADADLKASMNDVPEWATEGLNINPKDWAKRYSKIHPDTPFTVSSDFNEALLRDVAATMGMSYEDVLSRYNELIDPVPPVTPEDLSASHFEKELRTPGSKQRDNGHPKSPRKGDRSNRR